MTATDHGALPLAEAEWLAEQIVGWLAPACTRIAVAGSIRRRKAEVKDIEIVAIAGEEERPGLFGPERASALEALVAGLLGKRLAPHPERPANGLKYKRLWVPSHAVQLDLFITTPGQWGNLLAIRTGDADFSQALVLKASAGGLMPKGYFHHDGHLKHLERGVVPCPEESDFFRELGIAVVPPPETRTKGLALRLAARLRRAG